MTAPAASPASAGTPPRASGIRIVLARLDGGDDDAAVLDAAGQIAERFGAHVTAIHVRSAPPSIAELSGLEDEAAFAGFGESAEASAKRHAANALAHFEDWRMQHGWSIAEPHESDGPSVDYRDVDGDEPAILAERARLFDLAIATRRTAYATIDAMLAGTGHPILLVPPGWGGDLFRGAVLAWNGSVQAARAVGSSLPMLCALRGEVAIFSLAERKRPVVPEQAAEYLAWHDVRTIVAETNDKDVGTQLTELARERGLGMIVSGAFSHGRVRQAIFGGVTTHLIENTDVPVLFTS